MCGIAGILKRSATQPVTPAPLQAMARTLRHRGPDDEGFHVDPLGRCGLAFRRLSVIDLQTGNQPIGNATGDLHVVFNGEIYNFRALREELAATGCLFRTRGDAEVIVHAYERWGAACFARMSGMFAIALWDARRGELVLARDRFGKKPLVFAEFAGCFAFASEQKAILALPDAPRELDPDGLHRYLMLQYVPAPHAIFRNYGKLLPGHYAVIGESGAIEQKRYFELRPAVPLPADAPSRWKFSAGGPDFDELLRSAVERRLIADVPLGAFLSGGIDSSIVVALMRELGVSPLRTFSIRFDDPRYDESQHARRVAEHFETEHHEQTVTPDAREILDTLAHHYDEPFGDSSAIPTWYVSRHTRHFVTVALTGDGGDELFGGYDRYRAADLAGWLDWLPAACRHGLSRVGRWFPHGQARSSWNRLYRFLNAVGRDGVERYLDWVSVFPPPLLAEGYRPEFVERLSDKSAPIAWLGELWRSSPMEDRSSAAQRAMWTDLHSYLPYDLLTKVDIASMGCGLECRAPFLDHDLAAFAFGLPAAQRVGKRFLKDWARGRLPREILERPKMGFGVPVGEWFRGALRETLLEHVLAPESAARRIFRADWLERMVSGHLSEKENHAHRLWSLLMLELWGRRWRPTWT